MKKINLLDERTAIADKIIITLIKLKEPAILEAENYKTIEEIFQIATHEAELFFFYNIEAFKEKEQIQELKEYVMLCFDIKPKKVQKLRVQEIFAECIKKETIDLLLNKHNCVLLM